MAQASRKKIRDLNPVGRKPYGVYNRYDEYLNLLMNEIKIVHRDGTALDYVAETFAKRALLENGACGFDKITNQFYYVYGEGRNKYGKPVNLNFVTATGVTFARDASYNDEIDGAYIIDALPCGFTFGALIQEATNFMTNCDIAMRQNLEACKTPYIVICKDENLRLSFEQALQDKIMGQACIVVNEDLGDGLKAVNVGVDYLVDKFAEARDTERDILLTKLGVLTANTDKKERVQSAEVNANLGQASDYIYLLIDTFNKQCDTYGLDFQMVYNGSMEEIYLNNDEEIIDVDINDVENEGQKND